MDAIINSEHLKHSTIKVDLVKVGITEVNFSEEILKQLVEPDTHKTTAIVSLVPPSKLKTLFDNLPEQDIKNVSQKLLYLTSEYSQLPTNYITQCPLPNALIIEHVYSVFVNNVLNNKKLPIDITVQKMVDILIDFTQICMNNSVSDATEIIHGLFSVTANTNFHLKRSYINYTYLEQITNDVQQNNILLELYNKN